MQAAKHAVELDAAEQAAVLADFDRKTQPPAFEKYFWIFKAFYWLAGVVGAGSLISYYIFRHELPWDVLVGITVLVSMIVLIGAVPPIFLRAMAASEAYGKAEAALKLLSSAAQLDSAAQRHAALDIFAYTRVPRGVWSHNALNVAGAASQLPAHIDYVLAVERLLVRERGAAQLFAAHSPDGNA